MNVLALDVGGTAIKSALIINGQIKKMNECPSDGKLGGTYVIKNIMEVIDSYDNYDDIGISTTGQVDSNLGYIIYANENVPNYTGTHMSEILNLKYHKPVFVENDVNAAAIGEGRYGAGKMYKDFLCLTYGTGIGGAIVINNQIYKGTHGVAGEVGHMITHINGLVCSCGNHGCYEQYASTTALINKALYYNKNLVNGLLIFDAIEKGDHDVKNIVDAWIDEIIYGLVNLVHIFNPSCIILGGGIMKQKYIIQSINNKIKDNLMDSFKNVNIIEAELSNHAGVFGMAAIVENSEKH